MCACGKPGVVQVPDPTPWSIALAGLLLLSGKIDKKGKFGKNVDPEVVLANALFLRNFAETRAASANVVRIRNHKDDLKVQHAACELIEWLDAVMAAYTPLAGGKPSPARMLPPE